MFCEVFRSTTHCTKKVWSNLHAIRISPELKRLWASNIEMIVQKLLDPIRIQYCTQHVMQQLLKIRYPVSQSEASCSSSTALTQEEENTLCYAAGYISFALRQSYKGHGILSRKIFSFVYLSSAMRTLSAQIYLLTVPSGDSEKLMTWYTFFLYKEIKLEVRKYFVKDSIRKLMAGSKEKR